MTTEAPPADRGSSARSAPLSSALDLAPNALVLIDDAQTIVRANRAARILTGYDSDALVGRNYALIEPSMASHTIDTESDRSNFESVWVGAGGEHIPVLVSVGLADGGLAIAAQDLREQKRQEIERRHAQNLQSVGQLASGVAHEINAPLQFINDNVHFLKDCFADLCRLVPRYQALCRKAATRALTPEQIDALRSAEEDADLEYIQNKTPRAFEATVDGLVQVIKIVSAMRQFSRPDRGETAYADLNRAIKASLAVAKNEYKYVADVSLELGEMPPVLCTASEISQVILGLIVNAAEAIGHAKRGGDERGCIRIKSARQDGGICISVSDDGDGIAEELQHRIFEPFFSTKKGKHPGQGLAFSRTIIVEKHGGTLTFETHAGVGTTFSVWLPIHGPAEDAKNGEVQ